METNKNLIKTNAEEFTEKRGVSPEKIDFDSLIDSNLADGENWEKIKKEVRVKRVDKHYENLLAHLDLIIEGDNNSMIVKSSHGIGKTYQITEALEEKANGDFVKISGHSAPMRFYERVYEHRDSIIFLDDCEGLTGSKSALAVLKAITETDVEKRMVQWNSNSGQLEVPERFEFNGRVIMCFNDLPDSKHMEAVKSRSLYYNLELSYDQRIDLLKAVADNMDHDYLPLEERRKVVGWIEGVTDSSTKKEDINIRTMSNCFKHYHRHPERWRELCRDLFDARDEMSLIVELEDRYETVEEARKEWMKRTDKSRKSYFRKKKKLKEEGAI